MPEGQNYRELQNRSAVPPVRLWSLWDVIRVKLDYLIAVAQFSEAVAGQNWDRATELMLHGGSLYKLTRVCTELGLAVAAVQTGEMSETIRRHRVEVENIADEAKRNERRRIYDEWLIQEMRNLSDTLRRELKTKIGIVLTDPSASDLFENPRPFDSENVSVNDRFPVAVYDIQEAANCRALARPTACVFHLMRVLEVGLNALATDLGIPWPSRNDWQDVINSIERKIKEIEKGSIKFSGWHEKRQFYADAATQFTHFKDGWRNYALHFHAVYDDSKAEIIFGSVREFMRVLATRLSAVPSTEPSVNP